MLSVIGYRGRCARPLRGVICYLLSVIWAAALGRCAALSVICYLGRCARPLRGVICYLLSVIWGAALGRCAALSVISYQLLSPFGVGPRNISSLQFIRP
jgi:hypothetical protein